MTRDEYAQVVLIHSRLWPNQRVVPGMYETWESLLLDLPQSVVLAVVQTMATDGEEFAPGPGTVRSRTIEAMGTSGLAVDQALAEVRWMLGPGGGRYAEPEWSDPRIAATVEAIGGWHAICDSENPEAFRAHFMRLYDTVRLRETRDAAITPAAREVLAGLDLRADRALTEGT